jgi:hypothetical protein
MKSAVAEEPRAPTQAEIDKENDAWVSHVYMLDEIMVPALLEGRYEAIYAVHYGLIEVRPPRYNNFFSPWSNACTVFLRPTSKTAKMRCCACGKARGRAWLWSQFVPFQAADMVGVGGIVWSPVLDPLTPVCADHILGTWPSIPNEPIL